MTSNKPLLLIAFFQRQYLFSNHLSAADIAVPQKLSLRLSFTLSVWPLHSSVRLRVIHAHPDVLHTLSRSRLTSRTRPSISCPRPQPPSQSVAWLRNRSFHSTCRVRASCRQRSALNVESQICHVRDMWSTMLCTFSQTHTVCWKSARPNAESWGKFQKREICPAANLRSLPLDALPRLLTTSHLLTIWFVCQHLSCWHVRVCPWVRTPNVRLCMYPCMYFSRPGAINKPLVRHFCPKRPIEITAAHLSGKCVPLGVILWLRGRPIALSPSLSLSGFMCKAAPH